MALEGLAVLSLAGNIAQFLELGCKLFSKSRELYESAAGITAEDAQLGIIARSTQILSEGLIITGTDDVRRSADESNLMTLAKECKEMADQVLGALNQLKVKGSRSNWKCLRASLKRVWKSGQIEDIARRLDTCTTQLTSCMVKLLR
jgi:hypothetical protein